MQYLIGTENSCAGTEYLPFDSVYNDLNKYKVERKNISGVNFFQIDMPETDQCENDSKVSAIITDIILNKMRDNIIDKIIREEYFYLTEEEKVKIKNEALKILYGETENDSSFLNEWKQKIKKRIYDYLINNNEIILEGFIRFRLKDFVKEIEEGVDRAVDDLLVEREYNEFIKLLRYFVEVQDPKIEEVHIQFDPDKGYILYDLNHNVINNKLIEDLAKEISDKDITQDDLLISSLITIAPERVVIHNPNFIKNSEIINTINNVFYGKVKISDKKIK